MTAYLTLEIDEERVLDLLKKNHSLEEGDAVGRTEVTFGPSGNGTHQTVTVKLTYRLSANEVDELTR